MFGRKGSKPQNRIDSLIGAGTTVEGHVRFSGGLRVDGAVRGNISAENGKSGMLVVSEHARVEGEIRVPHIVINGAVEGPVHSAEHVELHSTASVTGDVHYNSLEMHLGAVVQGRLVHETGEAEKVVPLRPAAPE
jgi:cytoskeletal protein CcmA (bactofilin family)